MSVYKNLTPDPDVTDAEAWNTSSSVATATPVEGGIQIDVTSETSGPLIFQYSNVAAEVGHYYAGAMEIEVPAGFPAVPLHLAVYAYSGGGTVADSGTVTIQPGTTVKVESFSDDPTTVGLTGIRTIAYGVKTPAGARLILRRALLIDVGATGMPPGEIFSGSTDSTFLDRYSWDGTPNASSSTATLTETALVPQPEGTPVEYVEITLTDPPAEVETATWYRIIGSRQMRVSGAIKSYAAGGAQWIDQEAPYKVPITYRAELFDVDGDSLGFTEPAQVVLDVEGTRIHHPLDPSRTVKPFVRHPSGRVQSAPFDGELVRPSGRRVPIWLGAGRNALQGVPLEVFIETEEEDQALESIFGDYDEPMIPIVCIRTSEKLGLPQPFFALIKEPVKTTFYDEGDDYSIWDLTSDEVSRPTPMIVAAVLTYGDLEAAFDTYADLEAAYLTYLDMESDLSLAGTA